MQYVKNGSNKTENSQDWAKSKLGTYLGFEKRAGLQGIGSLTQCLEGPDINA